MRDSIVLFVGFQFGWVQVLPALFRTILPGRTLDLSQNTLSILPFSLGDLKNLVTPGEMICLVLQRFFSSSSKVGALGVFRWGLC